MTCREYRDESDYRRCQDLIVENYRDGGQVLYPSSMDLDFWRYIYDTSPDGVQKIVLWEDESGRLMGFLWLNDLVSHHQHREVENVILARAEKGQSAETAFFTYAFDCDTRRVQVLRDRGYRKDNVFQWYGKRDLSVTLPESRLPSGYSLTTVAGSGGVEERSALANLAMDADTVTGRKYETMMNEAKTYRADLDLVARSPQGKTVAFCTAWLDGVNRMGLLEPYGCHPEYRRKGLAKSLVCAAMRRLREAGANAVFVSHGGLESDEMDAALHLNRSVGFELVGKNYRWTLERQR